MLYIRLASSYIVKFIIGLLRLYQLFISPFLGSSCRFYPSCSEYSIQSFDRYGFLYGLILTAVRIIKCHPFHKGGYDPVPDSIGV